MRTVDVDTVIVGAGFAGLGMGAQLIRNQKTSFVILERCRQAGGTWRDNVYPGVACDIPSHLYSYSFRPRTEWSRLYAPGNEIQEYLLSTVIEEGLAPHLRFSAEATEMRWNESDRLWIVSTDSVNYRCRALIICAGRLSVPRIPAIRGLETFPGQIVHSARWDSSLQLARKRTAVVGSGASAIQLIPHIAETGGEVVQFQRSAPYVLPRGDRPYTNAEQGSFRKVPSAASLYRNELFWNAEAQFAARTGDASLIGLLTAKARKHLESQVPDPALRLRLSPDYTIGCKRILLSDDYYPALTRANVAVEPSELIGIQGSSLKGSSGRAYAVDLLVLATGFHSTRPPFSRRIFGIEGTRLFDYWRDRGMVSYMSTVVHRFPNMFVINGPNASLGHNSALQMIEAQIGYILLALGHVLTADRRAVMVKESAQQEYVQAVDRASSDTVWLRGGCRSWYVDDKTRRLELLWPGLVWEFQELLATFDESSYTMQPIPSASPPNVLSHDPEPG